VKARDDIARRLRVLLAERPPRAGSLVVSVFGDVVVPHGAAIWLGSLIRWLAPFGINERAVRTAIRRLLSDDWFTSTSIGRRSDYRLTEQSRHRFADAERRIYGAAPPPWDGSWSVVVLGHGGIRIEERDAARRELRWHGFGELAPSVLVHPAADLHELRLALRDLRLERRAIVLRARSEERLSNGAAPLRELVASAWDLRDLAREYRLYVQRFQPIAELCRTGSLPAPEVCFRLRVLAIHEYRRILLRDPELPPELLPDDWVGVEARSLCATLYRAIEARAADHVRDSGRTAAGPLPSPAKFYFRRFGGLRRSDRRARSIDVPAPPRQRVGKGGRDDAQANRNGRALAFAAGARAGRGGGA
jgi:phenylacetic acid degradation operon negative regulatory protein